MSCGHKFGIRVEEYAESKASIRVALVFIGCQRCRVIEFE
jgi:hypothetical protein